MRISYRWLTELLPRLSVPPEGLAERLTMLGLLVDEMLRPDRALEDVILGRVVRVAPHPAAERLKLCDVETGQRELHRIVCGAPVVKEGAYYAVALPGTVLPNGSAISATEIRGVQSEGMLCSAPELGLDHLGSSETILEIDPQGRQPGSPLPPALGLDDTIFVIDVPANRPDWESHRGVARELQALAGERLPPLSSLPALGQPDHADSFGGPAPAGGAASAAIDANAPGGGVGIRILDREGCPLYTGLVIHGVHVGPSPLRVQQRLATLGVRPINNVVDATNYVLLELGTPLHAFDLAKIVGREIIVRRAALGERLVTLDGRERVLDPEMTVIADRDRAIGIGGVMGGEDSEVAEATTGVFLEAAFFDPAWVRQTAARLGLRTEASQRFGRGVDPAAVPAGLRRGGELIRDWAGGALAPGALMAGKEPPAAPPLSLRAERVAATLGLPVGIAEAREALAEVDLPAEESGERLLVQVPAHRFDLVREIDLVEEVIRRRGYGKVPAQPLLAPTEGSGQTRAERVAELVERLRGLGLDQAYTPSFFDPTPYGPGFYEGRLLEQANPLAQNEPFLRPSLVPTLLLAARFNLRRGSEGVALFEVGHVFLREQPDGAARPEQELPRLPGVRERRTVALVLAGSPQPGHWSDGGKGREVDFFDAAGVVDALLKDMDVTRRASAEAWLHPGQQARLEIAGRPFGFVGRLHPRVQRALDLEVSPVVAELELEVLLQPFRERRVEPPSPFPRVERDLALVVPEDMPYAAVLELIRKADVPHLVDLRLFDVYRGDPVPTGAKSLAFRLVFQSVERTLTDIDIERELRTLLGVLSEAGIRLR